MNRNILKAYAPKARREFIQAVSNRAARVGLFADKTLPVHSKGDVALIGGQPFPKRVGEQREALETRIAKHGFGQVMEAMAYTWFNRLAAIRFMELHGYLEHGYRVLSHPDVSKVGGVPEIMEHAEHVDLPGLNKNLVIDLKLDGRKNEELYRLLLIAQCNALHTAMPFLFERVDDETDLLLPDNLLHSDSLIRKMVNEISEEDWKEVEIIGWIYQFYISEKKDEVIGKVVKSEDIPAATQLFTPNWIVKYLVQNSLGRQWLATYPDSPLKAKMEYYIEPAEQTPEVQSQLKAITPESLNPEELTLLDPACGSGHILVEAYDLLKEIYLERGYRLRDIPKLILAKNLFGLEIDDRAAQLAAFAMMMKARADDRRVFENDVQPNVLSIQESNGLDVNAVIQAFTDRKLSNNNVLTPGEFGFMSGIRMPLFEQEGQTADLAGNAIADALKALLDLFKNAKTFGSLIRVPEPLVGRLPAITSAVQAAMADRNLAVQNAAAIAKVFVSQALLLAKRYDAVVANPPYMGSKYMNPTLRSMAHGSYKLSSSDLYTMFIDRGFELSSSSGHNAMVTMHSWMFLSTYQDMRGSLFRRGHIETLMHMANMVMGIAFGTAATVWRCFPHDKKMGRFCFVSLSDLGQDGSPSIVPPDNDRNTSASSTDFQSLPRTPVAYWISPAVRNVFKDGQTVGSLATPTGGMTTGNNERFLRYWFEVNVQRIGFKIESRVAAQRSGLKWFPYNKGGEYRRWYGNNYFIVNWQNDGKDIIESGRAFPRSKERYFSRSITWTATSSSYFGVRHSETGFIFDAKGSSCFASGDDHWWLLGLLSTKQVEFFLSFLNPTIEFQTGDIAALPVPCSVTENSALN